MYFPLHSPGSVPVTLGSELLHRSLTSFLSCIQTDDEFVKRHRRLTSATLLASLIAISGCGDSGPEPPAEMGQVSGTMTIGGRAVEGVTVIFTPVEGGGDSRGQTDKDGNYELEYGGGGAKGAVIGKHRVAFEHYSEDLDAQGEPLPGGESLLPEKYFPGQSDITREVAAGEQIYNFELDGL